jgi:hypothetical protein
MISACLALYKITHTTGENRCNWTSSKCSLELLDQYWGKKYAFLIPSYNISRGEREGAEWVIREGVGAGGRNDPSLVCTYE